MFWNVGYYLPIGYVTTVLFADDQIMVTDSKGCCNEDKSQLNKAMNCAIIVIKCIVE